MKIKHTIATATIFASMLSPVLAQSRQPESATKPQFAQKTPSRSVKGDNRDAKLADAASINEDLIGFALDGRADKVAERVAALKKAFPLLRPFLNDSAFEDLERQMTDMEKASLKSDVLGIALVAVEAYRTLENAMDVARRPAPIEVAMLDYSGFKLSILAAAQTTDWPAIAAAAKEADSFWSSLAGKVQDKSIRNLFGAIQDGLKSAVEREDVHGVKFAAKMELEAVDVLEQFFKGAYRTDRGAAR